jgi:hypothetical protein
MGRRVIDMQGQRFGALTVRHLWGRNLRAAAVWKCLCDCGREIKAEGRDLRRGRKRSCGCAI